MQRGERDSAATVAGGKDLSADFRRKPLPYISKPRVSFEDGQSFPFCSDVVGSPDPDGFSKGSIVRR